MSDRISHTSDSFGFSPQKMRQAWLGIDKDADAIAFMQRTSGQAVAHGILFFSLLFIAFQSHGSFFRLQFIGLVTITLSLCWAFPARRTAVIAMTGLLYFLMRPFRSKDYYDEFTYLIGADGSKLLSNGGLILTGLVFLTFSYALIRNLDRKHFTFAANYPLITMFCLTMLLSVLSVTVSREGHFYAPIWISLCYLGSTFFFLGYILLDHRTKSRPSLQLEAGFMRPFWSGFPTPMKGPAYFSKFEAKTNEQLAITRLKSVKLIVWSLILYLVWEFGFNQFIYDGLGIPRLLPLIIASTQGESVSLGMRWLAVGINFFALVLQMAIAIHAVVAIIRMAGFAIPRGMIRPLESRTIAEFWGKYLFYFKEILVDFFFYPAFRRYFKKHPRLRMAFATFAAAFVGNILFDFIYSTPLLALQGVQTTLDHFIPYTVYAAVLTIGIIVSQQFQTPPKPEDGVFRYSVWPRVQVISFFALIQIIDDSSGNALLADRLVFFGKLFAVGA